jgi:hypothetical protein
MILGYLETYKSIFKQLDICNARIRNPINPLLIRDDSHRVSEADVISHAECIARKNPPLERREGGR